MKKFAKIRLRHSSANRNLRYCIIWESELIQDGSDDDLSVDNCRIGYTGENAHGYGSKIRSVPVEWRARVRRCRQGLRSDRVRHPPDRRRLRDKQPAVFEREDLVRFLFGFALLLIRGWWCISYGGTFIGENAAHLGEIPCPMGG